MVPSSDDRGCHDFITGTICFTLAIGLGTLMVRAGHAVVVHCFKQDEIFFWVAIAIAIFVWFVEEMLHLTFPCRRSLRRLAHRLTQLWLKYLHQPARRTR